MAEITPEQYQARTDAINAQTAAMRDGTAAMRESLTVPEPYRRKTDEELWEFYAAARGCSDYCRTDAEAAKFADDMLVRHRSKFPK